MALVNFIESFSEVTLNGNDSKHTWNQFLIFDFAALRTIKFVDNDTICQASEILCRFIKNPRTKQAYLDNDRNCLTYSFNYLRKQLFLLRKHYDDTKQRVIVDLLSLLKELCDGLLQPQQTKTTPIYPMDGTLSVLDILIESDSDLSIKLPSCSIIGQLLKLVINKRFSIEDKSILASAVTHVFALVGEDVGIFKQQCCVASIYLKGVFCNVFEEMELLKKWIEIVCIGCISKDTDPSSLMDMFHCIAALCKIVKTPVNSLIFKLDIFISFYENKLFEHDLIIIISKAVLDTCRQNKIALTSEKLLENEMKQVLEQFQRRATCTDDLLFIVLILEFTYSRLTLDKIQLKRIILIKLDMNSNLSNLVLKSIAALFTLSFEESDPLFIKYSNRLFEDLLKADNLESVIAYDRNQFYWIMKNAHRALKWNVLKLWIKNGQNQNRIILEIIQECKCGYLLPEYLETDIRDSIVPLIRSLKSPEVSQILCEIIPNYVTQSEMLRVILSCQPAVPDAESTASVYLNFFLNVIINQLYKDDGLTAMLQYSFCIVREYRNSESIAKKICEPRAIQGVLDAVYADQDSESEAWDHAVNILFIAGLMKEDHKFEVKQPIHVDILKFLSPWKSDTHSTSYLYKFDTIIKFARYILKLKSSNKFFQIPADKYRATVLLCIDSPDNADLKVVLKVVKRLLELCPDLTFMSTLNAYISYHCNIVQATGSYFDDFLSFLKVFFRTRKEHPWKIVPITQKSLLAFGNRFKNEYDVNFVFEYYRNSGEIEFAKELLEVTSI